MLHLAIVGEEIARSGIVSTWIGKIIRVITKRAINLIWQDNQGDQEHWLES